MRKSLTSFVVIPFLLIVQILSPAVALAVENPLDFSVPPTDVSVNFLANIFGIVDGVLYGGGS